jgi:hypothetical protein
VSAGLNLTEPEVSTTLERDKTDDGKNSIEFKRNLIAAQINFRLFFFRYS